MSAYLVIEVTPSDLDEQAVRDFFDSAEYAPLRTFRQSFATASALVIED